MFETNSAPRKYTYIVHVNENILMFVSIRLQCSPISIATLVSFTQLATHAHSLHLSPQSKNCHLAFYIYFVRTNVHVHIHDLPTENNA